MTLTIDFLNPAHIAVLSAFVFLFCLGANSDKNAFEFFNNFNAGCLIITAFAFIASCIWLIISSL